MARNLSQVKAMTIVKVPGRDPRAEGGYLGEEERKTEFKA